MIDNILENIYISVLAGIFCMFFLSTTGFIAHFPVSPLYTLISVITTLSCFFILARKDRIKSKTVITSLLICILAILFAGLLSYTLIDISFDGRWYHQAGIISLKSGYNPIYDNIKEYASGLYDGIFYHSLVWIKHYPKFSEICAANIYALTNKIETGKIINYLFLLLCFIYSYTTLNKLAENKKLNLLSSFLIIFNPVAICQIATYYVDGLLYFAFINAVLSVINIEIKSSKRLHIISLLINLTVLANIKMAGIVYGFLILFIWFIYLIFNKNKARIRNLLIPVTVVYSLLTVFTGINPYFTNIKEGKNLFYPFAGNEKIDIMTHNTPKEFLSKNSVYKLFVSSFAATDNIFSDSNEKIRIKTPFSIVNQEIFKYPDMRVGGFGYLWSGILLLTLYILFTLKFNRKDNKKLFILIILQLLIPLLINPESWWARYVPWFWAIPVIICYFSIVQDCRKKLACIVLLLMFVNSFIVFVQNFAQTANTSYITNKYLKRISKEKTLKLYNDYKNPTYDESYPLKLDERNIQYVFVSEKEYNKGCFEVIVKNMDKRLYVECNSYE